MPSIVVHDAWAAYEGSYAEHCRFAPLYGRLADAELASFIHAFTRCLSE